MGVKKCFSVVGYHNAGKTTLISKMIPLIREKGFTVSVVKHAKHMGLKDSDILFQAGSEETIATADDFSVKYFRLTKLGQLLSFVNGEVLIIEGFKGEPFPKILRGKSLSEIEGLIDELTIACVLDDFKEGDLRGIPVFSPDEVEKIVRIALDRSFPPLPLFNCGGCGLRNCREMAIAILMGERSYPDCVALPSKVSLKVNGVQVPLKPFVEEVFMALNTALVGVLKESSREIRRIELKIEL
ncbi:MAG: molybdopterin-guanine dinucleotide biosynthesis protein MobB [Synergistetes bacterium]|nr:molybdopterin-guanine dinucleotide biosynthesis protein MobB [Synergistota bacterium]